MINTDGIPTIAHHPGRRPSYDLEAGLERVIAGLDTAMGRIAAESAEEPTAYAEVAVAWAEARRALREYRLGNLSLPTAEAWGRGLRMVEGDGPGYTLTDTGRRMLQPCPGCEERCGQCR